MTLIAEGGGRTVTNCSVYDRRKVYEIVTSAVLDVVQSNGCGEIEKTGETVTQEIVYHVIARSEPLARALYESHWGSEFRRHTFVSIKPLFVIDAEINAGHN